MQAYTIKVVVREGQDLEENDRNGDAGSADMFLDAIGMLRYVADRRR